MQYEIMEVGKCYIEEDFFEDVIIEETIPYDVVYATKLVLEGYKEYPTWNDDVKVTTYLKEEEEVVDSFEYLFEFH